MDAIMKRRHKIESRMRVRGPNTRKSKIKLNFLHFNLGEDKLGNTIMKNG